MIKTLIAFRHGDVKKFCVEFIHEKKGENKMEIELMVQIGILFCLVYIIWVLKAAHEVRTEYWEALYTKLDEIKEKQDS